MWPKLHHRFYGHAALCQRIISFMCVCVEDLISIVHWKARGVSSLNRQKYKVIYCSHENQSKINLNRRLIGNHSAEMWSDGID